MTCQACSESLVSEHPSLCKEHFIKDFEKRVARTIKEHDLLSKDDKVVVAASGGKDSLSTLFVLKKLGYKVSALAVDEGIHPYRDDSLKTLKEFCDEQGIPLHVVSFKDSFTHDLDVILKEHADVHPCSVCGTFRRWLLNKHARDYDVIATGHNADDEAQAVLMNACRAQTHLFSRLGPTTTSPSGCFVKRVKPLYFHSEKEVLTYALLQGFAGSWAECPYAHVSYRGLVRDAFNEYVARHPVARLQVLERFLQLKQALPTVTGGASSCTICGEPSSNEECRACLLAAKIR